MDQPAFVDADFAEALSNPDTGRRSSDAKVERKTRQFCRQVQRALNMALADWTAADHPGGVFVEEVSPAPHCGHLLVHIAVHDGQSIAEALGALRSDATHLRSEVARSIARKRAPELSFVPAMPQGGIDD
jgi:ribosome-binding factor A